MKKSLTPKKRKIQKNVEISALRGQVETHVTAQVECCVCYKIWEEDFAGIDDITAESEAAKILHKEGWRVTSSNYLQIEGIFCPECVKMLDKKRGE